MSVEIDIPNPFSKIAFQDGLRKCDNKMPMCDAVDSLDCSLLYGQFGHLSIWKNLLLYMAGK